MMTLNDLSNEILLMICKELNHFDILYSVQNINERFFQIIRNLMSINRLTFVQRNYFEFLDLISSDDILDQFSFNIRPEIVDQIQWIDLNASRIKHVLCTRNYSNLYGLGLYNIDEKSAQYLLNDKNLFNETLQSSIKTLVLTFDNEFENSIEIFSLMINVINKIFNIFTGLTTLMFSEVKYKNCFQLDFDEYPMNHFTSSILQKLTVHVETFDDCLYLLDGRFPQLKTMHIDLPTIRPAKRIRNEGLLPNLKCFSLSCQCLIIDYDEVIPPLLCRMFNLIKLNLSLIVGLIRVDQQKFIDGNILKRDILNHLTKLNKFDFFIHSVKFKQDETTTTTLLSLIEDIQRTFIDFVPRNSIKFCISYFPKSKQIHCHMYSKRCSMKYYNFITNQFQDGIFHSVRVISLVDDIPFENEFFLRIYKSFPLLEELSIMNDEKQAKKELFKSNDHQENFFPLKYSHLHEVCLVRGHDDYVELFLLNTKTVFEKKFILRIKYESLQRVTNNFTNDQIQINCKETSQLYLYNIRDQFSISIVQEYFPYAPIFRGYSF